MTMMTNVKIVVAEDAVVVNEDLWTCLDDEKAFFSQSKKARLKEKLI